MERQDKNSLEDFNTKSKAHWIASALLILTILAFQSCKDDEPDPPAEMVCSTENMSYSMDIQPIIETNCYGCHHSGMDPIGGFSLESYQAVTFGENVDTTAANGPYLLCLLKHDQGLCDSVPYMPPVEAGGPLSNCDIAKIESWINDGAMDN